MRASKTYFQWAMMIIVLLLVGGPTTLSAGQPASAGFEAPAPIPDDLTAQPERAAPGARVGDWAHQQSDLSPDPQAIFGRLENGFRYVLRPNGKPQGRVSLHLVIGAGSLHETDEQRGIAHFLEHMLFNGSTHFPPGELVKYFQKIGMQFGPDANARTGFYDTVYDINLPAANRQSLGEALQVMQDYAEGALLLPSEIERERGVIMAEKRMRDSADYRAYVASLNFELAGTRFPDRLPIGSEKIIQSANRGAFQAFYDTWYRPDNMVLVMVGDVDPGLARELVEKQFGPMTARAPSKALPPIGEIAHEGLKTFYHHEKEIGSTSVTLQVLDHTAPPRDGAAYRGRRIEEQLASQIIQNRLNRKLSRPAAPVTDASVGSGIFLRQVRYGYISADCQPANWREALALIEQELRQALRFGFTEAEFERARKELLAELELAAEQAATRDSSMLARGLIYAVTNDLVFRSPEQEKAFADSYLAEVTPADLLERLRGVWDRSHRLVLVSGNAEIAAPNGRPEDEIAAVYHQSQAVAVAPPAEASAVAFPYLDPPAGAGRVVDRRHFEDLGVSTLRFANNVHLNFKSSDYTANEVQFVLSFGDGRAGVPAAAPALAALAEEVVNESGFGQLDKESLMQALAGKKTALAFRVQDDRFTIEGHSTPEEIELMFQLLYTAVRDPAFRADAWQLALQRYQQRHRSMRQSVEGVMNLYGWRFLSGGDPRFGLPSPEDLAGLSADDLAAWIGPALRRGAMELSVVGDVGEETVVDLAARYLGTLAPREAAQTASALRTGPVFPEARRMEVPIASQIDKALLVMALPTDDIWDIGRTRRLNVLADIIGERLRLRVREKLGAAYSTSAFSWPSRTYEDYGLLIISIPLAPKTLGRVRDEVGVILADIRQEGVAPDELQRALEPILAGIRDRFRENDYWLDTVLANASRHPEQLTWSRTIMEDYAGIRGEEIDQLADRYLDLSKMAVIEARAQSAP